MPASPLTPRERTLRARLAAHSRWAQDDPREGTSKARKTFYDSFLTKVDPDGVLPEAERQRRAESARKAHYTKMALASARSRRRA